MCTYILDNLEKTGLKNGGVQTRVSTTYDFEDYYTLIGEGVRAGVPSIIVEHCFLSNPDDAKFISNSDGTLNTENIEKMGKADADAVVTYFKLSEKTAVADNNTCLLYTSRKQDISIRYTVMYQVFTAMSMTGLLHQVVWELTKLMI